jgi:predicted dehydrogenase
MHAPMLAAGPETLLAGVWARRPEAAAAVADAWGAPAFDRFEDLLESCEAVAFAVPPAVQAELAGAAARAGRSLLLDKPIAGDLGAARRLADLVGEHGVASQVVLSWRYSAAVRAFLADAKGFDAIGGRGAFVSSAFLGGPFATPWRLERGPLLDLGPHVIDLLDAALGTVVAVRAHGNPTGWVGLLLDHDGGRSSEASLCATAAVDPSVAGVELFGPAGSRRIDCATAVGPEAFSALRREFAATVRSGGADHPLDVHGGLHLQTIIDAAERQLLSP